MPEANPVHMRYDSEAADATPTISERESKGEESGGERQQVTPPTIDPEANDAQSVRVYHTPA